MRAEQKWREPPASRFKPIAIIFAVLFIASAIIAAVLNVIPMWIAGAYAAASVISLIAYGWDKSKARRGAWRTAEATLHLFDAIGGWPGGLAAQQLFRHKTRKVSFQLIFWLTTVGHLAFWAWVVVNQKLHWLHSLFSSGH